MCSLVLICIHKNLVPSTVFHFYEIFIHMKEITQHGAHCDSYKWDTIYGLFTWHDFKFHPIVLKKNPLHIYVSFSLSIQLMMNIWCFLTFLSTRKSAPMNIYEQIFCGHALNSIDYLSKSRIAELYDNSVLRNSLHKYRDQTI